MCKVIYNSVIPFKDFNAINLFGVLFARRNAIINERIIRHEVIHTAQMKETLYVFFYVWYLIEWVIRLFAFKGTKFAYMNISFEREAYANDNYSDYLNERKLFAFLDYL